jgi:hypothetical protein
MRRPQVRIPLWAAVALPAAAYCIRSIARGFDFSPDLPDDVLVFGMLAVLLLAVAITRRSNKTYAGDEELTDEVDGEDHAADE